MKNNWQKSFFLPFLCMGLGTMHFIACDKVEFPYVKQVVAGPSDTTAPVVRKVLIEDFTGHKCGNCPGAAKTIETIKGLHPGRVISIAVHCNFYAIPKTAPFDYDFRTAAGDDYDMFFSVPGQPIGMVNRTGYPANHWKSHSKWASIVDTVVTKAPVADIRITNSYTSSTRVLNTKVRTEFLNPMNGAYSLVVLLTEDSIVKPQVDYSKPAGQQDVLDYVHRHVLRGAISSTSWGDVIASGTIDAGDTAVKTLQYTLPASFFGLAPDVSHCYVVAYVYNSVTYEVLQVEEKKIK